MTLGDLSLHIYEFQLKKNDAKILFIARSTLRRSATDGRRAAGWTLWRVPAPLCARRATRPPWLRPPRPPPPSPPRSPPLLDLRLIASGASRQRAASLNASSDDLLSDETFKHHLQLGIYKPDGRLNLTEVTNHILASKYQLPANPCSEIFSAADASKCFRKYFRPPYLDTEFLFPDSYWRYYTQWQMCSNLNLTVFSDCCRRTRLATEHPLRFHKIYFNPRYRRLISTL